LWAIVLKSSLIMQTRRAPKDLTKHCKKKQVVLFGSWNLEFRLRQVLLTKSTQVLGRLKEYLKRELRPSKAKHLNLISPLRRK